MEQKQTGEGEGDAEEPGYVTFGYLFLFLQSPVKPLEALHSFSEQFGITKALPFPACEHRVDADAFMPVKFAVLQIGIMHHLRHAQDGLVREPEPLYQSFEGAIVSMVRKLGVRHVEGER